MTAVPPVPRKETRLQRHLNILYGSQTGNGQAIAEALHDEALQRGLISWIRPLNAWKQVEPSLGENGPVIIVCSTTGNADPPENCARFWRFIRKRTMVPDTFARMKFAVLALGDTNYDRFCYIGKSIHSRLRELGGTPMQDVVCVDEGTGNMEEVVEPWIVGIWDVVAEVWRYNNTFAASEQQHDVEETGQHLMMAKSRNGSISSDNINVSPSPLSIPLSDMSLLNGNVTFPALTNNTPPLELELPKGLRKLNEFLTLTKYDPISEPGYVTPPGSIARLRSTMHLSLSLPSPATTSSSLNNPSPATVTSDTTGYRPPHPISDDDVSSSTSNNSCFRELFHAEVLKWRYLTKGGREVPRRALHIDVSLKGSGIVYEPGDAFGVYSRNNEKSVAYALSLLEPTLPDGASADTLLMVNASRHSSTTIPSPCSLRMALTHYVDLSSPPRRPVIRAFAEHCSNPEDERLLLILCLMTQLGSALYDDFILKQELNVLELLSLFPSCCPPATVFLAAVPPIPPRYYSAASSPLVVGNEYVQFAFTIVDFWCTQSGVQRKGLCTNWLEGLCKNGNKEKIPIFLRPTKEFFLPGSPRWPCILIAPGTGVSPFIGFLQHRNGNEKKRVEAACAVPCGTWRGGYEVGTATIEDGEDQGIDKWLINEGSGQVWLFFGNRNRQEDWIFQEEMEIFLEAGTLTRLVTAFSREEHVNGDGSSSPSSKMYVQHRIREYGDSVAKLVMEEGAYIYVCGDGQKTNMTKDVHSALVGALSKYLGGHNAAETLLKSLKRRRRYVMDAW